MNKNKDLIEEGKIYDSVYSILFGAFYRASLLPYPVGGVPDVASKCPNCHKYINYVNPYDDGETWME